jgi:hypothetical protein
LKKFFCKLAWFILPLTVFLADGFLPSSTFAYRPWEAQRFVNNRDFISPFYPNQDLVMHSMGDLCHHTAFAIVRRERWITDSLGFRNDYFTRKAKVVLIGDSFFAGAGLDQDSTITNVLKRKLNTEVYCMAPASFDDFIYLISNRVIDKPDMVIFSINEQKIPAPIVANNQRTIQLHPDDFSVFRDKATRLYGINYLKARLLKAQGKGVPGKIDNTMFFSTAHARDTLHGNVNEVVDNIASFDAYCRSIGVKFLLLPLPNKESVYYENVPFAYKHGYLEQVDSLLAVKKVPTVNALDVFIARKKVSTRYLYQKDDTHWNPEGVELIADAICSKVRNVD